ncbi:MAG: polynucleotide adenylyltransferase PcnB [Planctomycetes bacterium]|nr:polynucleotide adenylyltransferase PcnB [Planctomycetota bacterium]
MTEPLVIARPDHPVSRQDIDEDALRILYRLKKNGYAAYVVGGAVRDIIRGETPKDIDIATDATPFELRDLFHNSRIIGRRFRIVHVFFGSKNIEVATLRRQVEQDSSADNLYLDDDNQWGDVESDSFRRDFTMNALFYDINDFSIIDYTGGVEDVHNGIVRCIGEPGVRFQEDPVRMLRAIKFAARYQFEIEEKTEDAMEAYSAEISKASTPRVTEELFRIIGQSHCSDGLNMLADFGFLDELWPTWLDAIGEEGFEQVIEFFKRVENEAKDSRYYPVEFIAAGLFLPFLDVIDPETGNYQDHVGRISSEIRSVADAMDLPKRMVAAIVSLLRGQIYLLFFYDRKKNIQRFIHSQDFDWVWSMHELAFGDIAELDPVRAQWMEIIEHRESALSGWLDSRDMRDVFSFRGKTGGGRVQQDTGPRQFVNGRQQGRRRRRRR